MKHIVKTLEAELQQVENLLKHNRNRAADLDNEQKSVSANVAELEARKDSLASAISGVKALQS